MNRKDIQYYVNGILVGDKYILSKSVTLMESELMEDKALSNEVLQKISTRGVDSIRIGITGVPGVGKSTFIEAFGEYLISLGNKVAVLAIDPSSEKTGGSILGDKTRMNNLSTNANAFIRPSPAKGALGGVSGATRENIILFEAAGYNVIIVETVGVGQSETLVRGMVDFFLLLMLPGAGDELQGIKKGIMEMADGLVINKADGGELTKAKQAQTDYKNALHLFSPTVSGWIPQVKICSSLDKTGIDEVWKMISDFVELLNKNDFLSKNRSDQNMTWFREQIPQTLMNEVFKNENNLELKGELEEQIKEGKLIPKEALSQLIKGLRIK